MSRRILPSLALSLVLLAACGRESASTAASAPETAIAPAAPTMATQAVDVASVVGPTADRARPRDVVRSADVHLRGTHPARVVDAARRWVEAHEGFVDDASASGVGTAMASSRATLRVPSAVYADALRELRSLGTVLEVTEHGEDVTATRADAEARLGAKRALEQRLIALTQHAGTVAELVQVENELGRVRADIESMEATHRALVDRIAYATIRLAVDSPEQPVVARVESFGSRLHGSFASGVGAAESLVVGAVTLLVALSPLCALGLALYAAIRFARRRSRTTSAVAA